MIPFGIRPTHVNSAIEEPDVMQNFEYGDLEVVLKLKTSEQTVPPTTILTIERRVGEEEYTIDAVYKTHLNKLGLELSSKPFDVIKKIALRFGPTLVIGHQESKFHEESTISHDGNPQPISVKEDDSVLITQYVMPTENNYQVAFAFGIKTNEYQLWFKE